MSRHDLIHLDARWLRWIATTAAERGLTVRRFDRDGVGIDGDSMSIGQRPCRGRIATFLSLWRAGEVVGEWRLVLEGEADARRAQERAWQAVLLEAAFLDAGLSPEEPLLAAK